MFAVSKFIEFDAGHRVPLHESKCKNPHGHRYKVVAYVNAGELVNHGPESGMVRDFGIIKQLLMAKVHDVFDHGFIIYNQDTQMLGAFKVDGIVDGDVRDFSSEYGWKIIVVPFYPTAENLAKYIYDLLKPDLPGLEQIDVWETPTSRAIYMDDETFFTEIKALEETSDEEG